jgi:hypothetical protein
MLACALAVVAVAPGLARTAGATSKAVPPKVLPFIADDYGKALAEARAKRLPIFVETWAPW